MTEQNQKFSIVEIIAGKVVLAVMTLGFGGWLVVSTYERFVEITTAPDLNGDGKFSILDVPQATFSILIEIGNRYQAILADHPVGKFLEMSAARPNIFWSVVLTAFTYFLVIMWSRWLFNLGGDDH